MQIVSTPRLVANVEKDGKTVQKTFHYGFLNYTIQEEKKKCQILEPHSLLVQEVYCQIGKWIYATLSSSHKNAFGFILKRHSKMAVEKLSPLFKKGGYHFAIDIADAFPNITDKMVKSALKENGVEECLTEVLAWFVTHQYNGQRRLPQKLSKKK